MCHPSCTSVQPTLTEMPAPHHGVQHHRQQEMTKPSLLRLIQQLDQTTGNDNVQNTTSDDSSMNMEDSMEFVTTNAFQSSGLPQTSHLFPVESTTDATTDTKNLAHNTTCTTLPSQEVRHSCNMTTTTSSTLSLLQNVISDNNDLSMLDHETLQQYLSPIRMALQEMNAESVLDLKRTSSGARVRSNVFCKPIHEEILPPRTAQNNIVRYLHVSEVEGKYSIGIFVFPPHASIPLHDHPGMCVLSRILYGDLHRTSLDLQPQRSNSWLSQYLYSRNNNKNDEKHAVYNGVDVLQAPQVTVLYPYKGNLHEFVAGPHGAAVLDVLLPPYNSDRDCTFYHIQQQQQELQEGQTYTLVPTGQPEDFHCLSGTYGNVGQDD